jgi:myo-inositol-1(or 4)-monophosphatase
MDPTWIRPRLRWAVRLVRRVGRQLRQAWTQSDGPVPMEWKDEGRRHPVTRLDRVVEETIVQEIFQKDPKAQVLTEESGVLGPARSRARWILDPIDGTSNFIHGFPHFAISLALEYEGRLVLGVVYDPVKRECFWAGAGMGAFLNGRPIRVSSVRSVNEALLGTGFTYHVYEHMDRTLQIFRGFLYTAMGIRRAGAAALDLCYVAAGRLDGFWEEHLSPWDVAAGVLILQEAGGRWTDFALQPTSIYDGELLASNGLIHDQMGEVIRWALAAESG